MRGRGRERATIWGGDSDTAVPVLQYRQGKVPLANAEHEQHMAYRLHARVMASALHGHTARPDMSQHGVALHGNNPHPLSDCTTGTVLMCSSYYLGHPSPLRGPTSPLRGPTSANPVGTQQGCPPPAQPADAAMQGWARQMRRPHHRRLKRSQQPRCC